MVSDRRNGSHWRYVLALAGLALLAVVFGLGLMLGASHDSKEERYQTYRYAADKPTEVEPSAATKTITKPFEYRTPCSEPKGESESDLCAQWRAAKAGEDSAFWAKWGFGIAIVGSAFLLWQIILTRRAVEDTGEATKAMREANKISRENSHMELRAYLSVKSIVLREDEWDQNSLQLLIEIQNSGQTPAVLQKVVLNAQWIYQGGSVVLVDHTSKNDVKCHRDTPMHMAFNFSFDEDSLDELGQLIVIGRIEYQDVFGKIQMERHGFQTPAGSLLTFHEHTLPTRLSAFSALAMLEQIESEKAKREAAKEG